MKTPITYYGGKQTMLKYIKPLIPIHNLYCEPFAGGAPVFFDKLPAKVNIINDLNKELINFYRVIVSQPEDLKREVLCTLHSRVQHKHAGYIYQNPLYFSEVQRAWAIWVLSNQSFSGILTSSFSIEKNRGAKARKIKNAKLVFCDELRELLEKATIECNDAFAVIKKYDTSESFFFLDPPYVGCDMGHYSGMFDDSSLEKLLRLCSDLKGRFMLTMYPNEIIKRYSDENGWIIHSVERRVSASNKEKKRKQIEWMVCNYSI